jgi:hypothetical protein
MTADLPIFVTFEPVEIPFATRKEVALRRNAAADHNDKGGLSR